MTKFGRQLIEKQTLLTKKGIRLLGTLIVIDVYLLKINEKSILILIFETITNDKVHEYFL